MRLLDIIMWIKILGFFLIIGFLIYLFDFKNRYVSLKHLYIISLLLNIMIFQIFFVNFDALTLILMSIIEIYEDALEQNYLILFFSDRNLGALFYIIYLEFRVLDLKFSIFICYLLKKLYFKLLKKK